MPVVGATTLQRGLELLQLLATAELEGSGPLVGARLAESLQIDPAQVSRMLKGLLQQELVAFDTETRSYRLGAGYFRLAGKAAEQHGVERYRPVLRGLVVELQSPAWVSVLLGASALTVAAERVNWSSHAPGTPGHLTPLWCTGPGRALLLDATDAELRERFDGTELIGGGPLSARSTTELIGRQREARESGVVVAESEFEFDVVEVSVPVRDAAGSIVSAITVAVPRRGMARESAAVLSAVRTAAALLSPSARAE